MPTVPVTEEPLWLFGRLVECSALDPVPDYPAAALAASAAILALLGTDGSGNKSAFCGLPVDGPPFPVLCWRDMSTGGDPTDTEGWLSRVIIMQVDCVAFDPAVARQLCAAVDGLADVRSVDSDSFSLKTIRRDSGWRRLDYERRLSTESARPCVQYSSDWTLVARRKQSP